MVGRRSRFRVSKTRACVTLDELEVPGVLVCHHNDGVSACGLFSAQFNEWKLTGVQRSPGPR